MPRRIIILRHGEKHDAYRLCSTGALRSLALVTKYLGKGARESLFMDGPPAAFFAITLHTLELIGPIAATWNLPVRMYAALPEPNDDAHGAELDQRTLEAAADALYNPAWDDKTIVMVWEHKRIASRTRTPTLRKLLNLNRRGLKVPTMWKEENYDFFWIVDYANKRYPKRPTRFRRRKQEFDAPFKNVPANRWGKAATLPADCKG
ncbi:MAG TPA: hypothetical protein VII56_12665 [Rhizomicrobium sp.]